MTIAKPRTRRPSRETAAESKFVAAAPDAKPQRWQRGTKTQITLSISPELLEDVDHHARSLHLSRAAFLTVILNEWLANQKQVVRNR